MKLEYELYRYILNNYGIVFIDEKEYPQVSELLKKVDINSGRAVRRSARLEIEL